ncbi:MAG: hypothetical protein IM638_20280 [Bacteroidetes bacterium]|nr:hypothetical protein [Bacteroidota bacterium]
MHTPCFALGLFEATLYLLLVIVLLAMIGSGVFLVIQTFRKSDSTESNVLKRFFTEWWRPLGLLAGLFILFILSYALWFTLIWCDFIL